MTDIEYTHFLFRIDEHDSDGDVSEEGIYLSSGNTTIRVARTLEGWLSFVKHIESMTNEIRENWESK